MHTKWEIIIAYVLFHCIQLPVNLIPHGKSNHLSQLCFFLPFCRFIDRFSTSYSPFIMIFFVMSTIFICNTLLCLNTVSFHFGYSTTLHFFCLIPTNISIHFHILTFIVCRQLRIEISLIFVRRWFCWHLSWHQLLSCVCSAMRWPMHLERSSTQLNNGMSFRNRIQNCFYSYFNTLRGISNWCAFEVDLKVQAMKSWPIHFKFNLSNLL